jgi:hypothetical protein
MQTITTIGLDIAKSVFQVHGVDRPRIVGREHYRTLGPESCLRWCSDVSNMRAGEPHAVSDIAHVARNKYPKRSKLFDPW